MAGHDEQAYAFAYVYGKLSGASAVTTLATGGIHRHRAPQVPGAPGPFLVMGAPRYRETRVLGGDRIMVRLDLDVKTVAKPEQFATSAALMKAVDAALTGSGGALVQNSVTVAQIHEVTREEGFTYEDDEFYEHHGYTWRIWLSGVG